LPERGFILSLLLLAGCGFHLQGALTFPPQLERTYIETIDTHSGFYRDLRTAMEAAGIDLTDTAADATATLRIDFDETDQRVLSVSARNVPTEYEVWYTIEYSLFSGQDNLIDRQMLTLTRDYTYDSTLVLGKAQEEELLREAIVDDLVRIVLKQISAL
jgi:LPS-assembly lipoprotein